MEFCIILTILHDYSYSTGYFLHNKYKFSFETLAIPLKVIDSELTKLSYENISDLQIFAFIFCVDLSTLELLWQCKTLLFTWTQSCISYLQKLNTNVRFGMSVGNLSFLVYSCELIRIIIGSSIMLPCIVRPRALRPPCLVGLLTEVTPSYIWSRKARCHHA